MKKTLDITCLPVFLMEKKVGAVEIIDSTNNNLGSTEFTWLCNLLDLVAVEATYYSTCHVQFLSNIREGEGNH